MEPIKIEKQKLPKQFFFSFVPEALWRSCRLFSSFLTADLKHSLNLNLLGEERHTFLICLASSQSQFSAVSHKGQATLKRLQIAPRVQNLAKFWEVIYSQPDVFHQVEAQGSLSYLVCQEQMGFSEFQKTKTFWEQFSGNIQNFLTPQGLICLCIEFQRA